MTELRLALGRCVPLLKMEMLPLGSHSTSCEPKST